jgi:hypothetical protein
LEDSKVDGADRVEEPREYPISSVRVNRLSFTGVLPAASVAATRDFFAHLPNPFPISFLYNQSER